MSTGVQVSDECVTAFQELKLNRKFKYIVYKIGQNNTMVEVEEKVPTGSYDEFVASLPQEDCRYAVFDFEYDTNGEGVRSKICFYVWAPDTSRIKQKMLYAASKDALRKKLVGVASELQCTDLSEIAYSTVLERVAR